MLIWEHSLCEDHVHLLILGANTIFNFKIYIYSILGKQTKKNMWYTWFFVFFHMGILFLGSNVCHMHVKYLNFSIEDAPTLVEVNWWDLRFGIAFKPSKEWKWTTHIIAQWHLHRGSLQFPLEAKTFWWGLCKKFAKWNDIWHLFGGIPLWSV